MSTKHLKVLGKGDFARLGDRERISNMLKNLVESVGMRLLSEPHVYEVETDIKKLGVEPFEDEGGVTAIAVLSTSHIAIHTWPLRNEFHFDLYSCRSFSSSAVVDVLKDVFNCVDLKVSDLTDACSW